MKKHSNLMHLQAAVVVLAFSASAASGSVSISSKPTKNMSCSSGVCSPTRKGATLNVTDLASMLASGDVTVTSGSSAQDINIEAALSWVSTSRLTFDAFHSLAFDEPVVVAGTGGVTIITNDGGVSGDFRFFRKGHIEFWDNDSSLVINGQPYTLVASVRQIAKAVNRSSFPLALAKHLNAKQQTYAHSPIPLLQDTFEGLGNTISNLTITDTTAGESVGFFGEFNNFGQAVSIRDVNLTSVNVLGGGIEQSVGGLVGFSQGLIQNSSVAGQVSASGATSFAGGLVGLNWIAIEHSWSSASVSGSNGAGAGGLVGNNFGSCSPECSGLIDQSYATGAVTVGDAEIGGGLVGQNFGGQVTNSYAKGSVAGGNNSFVGGLVGSNAANANDQSNPIIVSSYSIGSVSGGSGTEVGGLIGRDMAQTGTSNAYWNLDTSGVSDAGQGAGNVVNDPGITGLTTVQFQSGLPAGFNNSLWNEKTKLNSGFPYLLSVSP